MADKKSTESKPKKDADEKSPAQKHQEEMAKSHPYSKAPETKKAAKAAKGDEKSESKAEAKDEKSTTRAPKVKPTLSADQKAALAARDAKSDARPKFRRHEWWRYKKLGGKHAPWRVPRGIHSKTRRHFRYRPPLVSIGYRGPAAARGLHPSGFEEVMVHTLEELKALNKATQAARVGGTVGGRRAEQLEKEADKLGIRVLNRRS